MNCLLREGLAAGGEASTEVFESVLAEANLPDKMEKLDLAMPILAHSLQTPCGAYVNDLRFAPFYDRVRGAPRFQKLMATRDVVVPLDTEVPRTGAE